ncbi:Origin recognition complex, subunit 1 [Allomyces javanicus]|nr:Origin recognition complex, subunit 1 [Allomyces javanicus]
MTATASRKRARAATAPSTAADDTAPASPARPTSATSANTESPARNLRSRTRAGTAPPAPVPVTPKRGAKAATASTPSRALATPKAKATPSKTAATPSKAATPTRRRVAKAPSTPTPARKRTASARSPTAARTPATRRRGKLAQPAEDDESSSSSSSGGDESGSEFDEAKTSDHGDEEEGGSGSDEGSASESSDAEPEDEDSDSARPRKRARTASAGPGTPRRRAPAATRSTPSKRATPVRKKVARPIPEAAVPFLKRTLAERPTVKTYQLAKEVLHVSAVPEALPCREDEFATLYEMMESAIRDRTGRCLYVSGVPGTGKTATFFEVLRTVQRQVDAGDLLPFKFVEVNGMKVLDPGQAYSALWAGLAGEKVTIRHAQLLLSKYYAARGIYATLSSSSSGTTSKADAGNTDDEQEDTDQAAPTDAAAASSSASIMTPTDADPVVVLLLDELDLLVTKRQGVMYNLFEWAQAPRSRLIVVAIANTMDLPERLLTKRVASRLGMERIDFAPYTEPQLVEILRMRLGASCPVINDNAITFAARKVSTVNGDARRLLDVTRRAVELAEAAGAAKAPTKIKNSIPVPVDVAHIKHAADEMYASPAAQLLVALATSGAVVVQRVAVAVILAAQRRAGVRDVPVREVRDRVRETCTLGSITPVPAEQDVTRALVALAQGGIVMLDPKMLLVQLNVSEQDVLNAFRKDEQVSKLVKL